MSLISSGCNLPLLELLILTHFAPAALLSVIILDAALLLLRVIILDSSPIPFILVRPLSSSSLFCDPLVKIELIERLRLLPLLWVLGLLGLLVFFFSFA